MVSAKASRRTERKDAKDGATRQCRALANSDDDKRDPDRLSSQRNWERGHAHGLTKHDAG